MDRNLPGKSSYRSASSAASYRSSTSHSTRRYGANSARPSLNPGQIPARTHNNYSRDTRRESSRWVNEGNRESGTGSPSLQFEGEDEVKDCSGSQSIVGTCPSMCPEKERSQRERLRDLAVFERLDGNPGRTSSSLAVKKFCRTISTKDVQASDLRPLPVLEDTLNYLMKLLDSSDHPFEVVHDFIFDRTRSIRQDLSMQNIFSDRVIWMYEKMVKFHVISHHKLRRCKGDSSIISSIHHLNKEQLTKCLASLYNLYEVNRSSASIHENEAEFRSLFILLHLDSHTHPMGESLSLWLSQQPASIIKLKEMNFARRVLRLSILLVFPTPSEQYLYLKSWVALLDLLSFTPISLHVRYFRMGNYFQFLRTIASQATFLQFYVIEPFVSEVRALAVASLNSSGYKLHPYPLTHLSKILRMKDSDLEYFCNACGLETSQDDAGNKVLPTKQTGFCHPKGGFEYHVFSWIELSEKDPAVDHGL